jgi:RimJ/RimL family protein N-acetyltransferase
MIPGELVNLRAVERADAAIIHHWLNDPVVMRGWGYSAPVTSMQETARQVEEWLAQESALGHPAALIAETLAGEAIGLVILRVERPEAHAVELSLLVGDSDRWGQGFGADILRTTLETCFESWGCHRVGVRVEADNARALALYRRAGFLEEGRLRQAAFRDGQHADILLFGLLVAEWAALTDQERGDITRQAPSRPPASASPAD